MAAKSITNPGRYLSICKGESDCYVLTVDNNRDQAMLFDSLGDAMDAAYTLVRAEPTGMAAASPVR